MIIGITVGVAALGGYWYAERLRNAYDEFEIGDELLNASAALESAGRDGLKVWLQNYPKTVGAELMVLDQHRRDLLGRPLPMTLRRMVERHRRIVRPGERRFRDPANLRRARPLTQLLGPDGERYTFVLVPTRTGSVFGRGAPPGRFALVLALVISAAISLMLARTISNPIRKLRDATNALSQGDLSSRVATTLGSRNDEIGLLAKDFDEMAGNLQRAAAQQIELTRNVSHELRSPLARLRIALELARQNSADADEFDRMDLEVVRLDALIGQLLSFARLDSIVDGDKQSILLNELVADVVEDVNFENNSHGDLAVDFDTQKYADFHCSVHAESVRSAVENVLRNAVRHSTNQLPVTISLSSSDRKFVQVEVCDNGPGVADDKIDAIFEPFVRIDNSRNDGAGLGLAIAQRAMHMHGGQIFAENRPSGGLRVVLELPLPTES